MSDLRIFVKVDSEFLARLDAHCAETGTTRSGAVRTALEKQMAEKKSAAAPYWSTMTRERKIQMIRDAGQGQEAIAKVAADLRVPHDTVQRFAYRNGLIGPSAVAAAG